MSRVYDLINPTAHYESQTYAGKVVFVTRGCRSIGAETALQYARAGASVTLAARFLEMLEGVKSLILANRPDANVLNIAVDVANTREVERAISETVYHLGRLDIVVWKGGRSAALLKKDPDEWWSVVEVNIRVAKTVGVHNMNSFSIPHLLKTDKYAIFVSSMGARIRIPDGSDYAVSKHALGRSVEQVHPEYPEIRIFILYPGFIPTEMRSGTKADDPPTDSVALPAAAMLYLTGGNADWLIVRYVSANWDFGGN
ncbi:hypothetical protein B0H19DRAFT_1345924 [Mycena capillaripes]|nr:hypothetical protein B0H19DRAFT_1345924 [Mycena capillaripes]